ncbi:MAG: hypothetical protein ACRCZF_19635, partial [Gemmataceae bacterium]
MRNNLPNILTFVVVAALIVVGWYLLDVDRRLFPPPPATPKSESSSPELSVAAFQHAAAFGTAPVANWLEAGKITRKVTPDTPKPAVAVPPVVAPVAAPLAPASSEPHSLIALGDDSFFLKVLLTNVGGGVQQVILSKFNEANRLGLEEKDAANKPRPLHLIPGYIHPLPRQVSVEAPYIELNPNFAQPQFDAKQAPGPVAQKNLLARPSYTLLHYLA